jgi:hypothetical protein
VQINPFEKTVLGVYLIIVGLVMIIFHKQLKQMRDDWYEHLPSVFWRGPTGTLFTVTIVVFGAISILIGVTQFLLAFVQ